MQELELTIEELAEQVGVSVRTIRFYIAEGLLQGPGTRGKAANYSEEHLLRLRLIRRLSERRVPVAEMREMLSRLSTDEVRVLLETEGQQAMELERTRAQAQTAHNPSPKEYIAALLNRARQLPTPPVDKSVSAPMVPTLPTSTTPTTLAPIASYKASVPASLTGKTVEVWQHWELAPGVELHIRADVQAQRRTLIERLLRTANESE